MTYHTKTPIKSHHLHREFHWNRPRMTPRLRENWMPLLSRSAWQLRKLWLIMRGTDTKPPRSIDRGTSRRRSSQPCAQETHSYIGKRMCTTLAPPTHMIMNVSRLEFILLTPVGLSRNKRPICAIETVCMRIVIQANVADILLGHTEPHSLY